MATSLWKFRPSALTSATNVYTSASSRDELERHYKADNDRAIQEGVSILQRPESCALRTLQWNINSCFYNCFTFSDDTIIRKGLIDTIRDADADVVVLNEFVSWSSFSEHSLFEEELKGLGYSYVHCATADCPTALATRLKVKERKEIRLSDQRSALLVRVYAEDDTLVWVIGTHLDHVSGEQRQEEIQVLLKELNEMGVVGTKERIILVGDLNQQREHDYTSDEWEQIRSGMEHRRSCEDDGVAKLLMDQGFVCAWDSAPPPKTNWETSRPPATHWSGTIVDYSYGCNISPITMSISPAGWSDHRMTVCDWN